MFLLYVKNKCFRAQQNLGGTKNVGALPSNAPPWLRACSSMTLAEAKLVGICISQSNTLLPGREK